MLSDLFEYNQAMNKALLDAFGRYGDKASPKSISLMNHIVNAHQIWLARIQIQSATGVWDVRPLNDLVIQDRENHARTFNLLTSDDLSSKISYSNSRGDAFDNTIQDILFHVVNHSTYHRGQIAMDFRNSGLDPITTDFIFYKR